MVRSNVLFRSTQLANLDDDDLPAVEALNLAMVFDLRTAGEVERAPDVRVTDTYVWLDVLRDFAMATAVGSRMFSPIRGRLKPCCRTGLRPR